MAKSMINMINTLKRITIVFFLLSPYGISPDAAMVARHDTPGHLAGVRLAALLEYQGNEAPGVLHIFNIRLADGLAERLLFNAYPVHMADEHAQK